jgi:hypothetical protein
MNGIKFNIINFLNTINFFYIEIFLSYFSQEDILDRVKSFYLYSALIYTFLFVLALFFLTIGFESAKKSEEQLEQEKNVVEIDPIDPTNDPFLLEVNSLGVK